MLSDQNIQTPYIKKQIKDLQSGDTILHPLYRTDGLLLIDKNRVLNESLIKIIVRHISPTSTTLVASSEEYIENTTNNNDFKNDIANIMKENLEITNSNYDISCIDVEENLSSNPFVNQLSLCPYWILLENRFESNRVAQRCKYIKRELINLMNNNKTFDNYYNVIKAYDDVLLIHSINNVCTSIMIGLTLEIQNDDLIDLAIAALFLNIGFTHLPKHEFKNFLRSQIYNNVVMKKHIEYFSNVTIDEPFLRKRSIIQGILDHHEYYNGMGFPNQKKGEEISLFGRILHIVHSYDSMVGGYNYTTGTSPFEAFHVILENRELRFDPNIIPIFIHRTTYFKLGENVNLPDGTTGKIVGFDNYIKHPDAPIVELSDGKKYNLLTMENM
jgi:HD-GYP domain-containing protein (c-di-GMP phosphodiesterase class II)